MEYVAIMRKSWGLTEKILNGKKKVESRWYMAKCKPWNRIQRGEIIFFKDSGGPVLIKTYAKKVLQFSDLTPAKVKKILRQYGKQGGIEKGEELDFFKRFKNKRYCILIFLGNPRKVQPFDIDKTGFGAMAAWITVDNVSEIARKHFPVVS